MKKKKRSKVAAKRQSRPRRKNTTAPRTAAQYFARPPRFKDLWDRVVSVVSKIRTDKTSLQQASREIGISPRTVAKWGGSALRKNASGRYTAKTTDQLLRVLMVPTPEGPPKEIAIRGSRKATEISGYWNAVHRYLDTGDASGLKKFRRKKIGDANGQQISLITDLTKLDRLGSAGVLSFESLYARTQ